MVQTHNRIGSGLILPGGLVEVDESPATAAAREVSEELGIDITVQRLLAIEHRSAQSGRPSSVQFVFAPTKPLQEDLGLSLQPEEIAEAHWVPRDQVVERRALAGQQRTRAALNALDSGVPEYLETCAITEQATDASHRAKYQPNRSHHGMDHRQVVWIGSRLADLPLLQVRTSIYQLPMETAGWEAAALCLTQSLMTLRS